MIEAVFALVVGVAAGLVLGYGHAPLWAWLSVYGAMTLGLLVGMVLTRGEW